MTEGKSAAWTVGAGVMYHFDQDLFRFSGRRGRFL